jgi:hypothetical protein
MYIRYIRMNIRMSSQLHARPFYTREINLVPIKLEAVQDAAGLDIL